MKLPERILSTPRLMALILVSTTSYLAIKWVIGAESFVAVVMIAINYFFQQRKPESQAEPNQTSSNISSTTTTTVTPKAEPTEDLSLTKLEAYDPSDK